MYSPQQNSQLNIQQYEQTKIQSKNLANRMRMGTGVSSLMHQSKNPSHYQDALQRFQKDFAYYQRERRDQQNARRQADLQRKRIQHLQRQNNRWGRIENTFQKETNKAEENLKNLMDGSKRTAHSNSLAYNPINLEYNRNPEGQKLRIRDQDHKIRGYVRAHNMDFRGNSKYNPLTGQDRVGIEKVIPPELNDRYENKLFQHYDNIKIKVPNSSNSIRSKQHFNYY